MGLISLLLLAIGLSMDAFAVSVCKGLAMEKVSFRKAAVCGLWFGGFQALMPLLGYLLGSRFADYIDALSAWIAVVLLCAIGVNMIREALCKKSDEHPSKCEITGEQPGKCEQSGECSDKLDAKTMFLLAVATSIDALAVGITLACVPVTVLPVTELVNTLFAVAVIGLVTFALSCAGVKVGNLFGTRCRTKAELAGGAILILIGLRILLVHYGVL